jgi:linoleoyl-CoA desaturase
MAAIPLTLPAPFAAQRAEPSPPAEPETRTRPRFARDEGFLVDLKRRVDEYFRATGKSRRDNWQMYLKTAIILAWFAASYTLLVFFTTSVWLAVPLAVLLAVSMAVIGFSIQHDGGHGGYSRFGWVNKLAAMSLDLIGASSYLWYWKHAIFHHTYTNVQGHDTDIDVSGLVRFSPHVPRRPVHRWQHLYAWVLYGLSAGRWHLYGDFKDLATGHIGPHRVGRPKGWNLTAFIGGKVVSIGLLLVVPMFFHPWWLVLLFYLLATFVVGVVLSVVFQLAHCVGEAAFPLPAPETLQMESAWAVQQVETTVDFGRGSRILSWLLGGLNFQIEHHLFPKVCHVHYPALSKIVEETCREYGVKYQVHPTFWAGIVSHYRWLKRIGRAEPVSSGAGRGEATNPAARGRAAAGPSP